MTALRFIVDSMIKQGVNAESIAASVGLHVKDIGLKAKVRGYAVVGGERRTKNFLTTCVNCGQPILSSDNQSEVDGEWKIECGKCGSGQREELVFND